MLLCDLTIFDILYPIFKMFFKFLKISEQKSLCGARRSEKENALSEFRIPTILEQSEKQT